MSAALEQVWMRLPVVRGTTLAAQLAPAGTVSGSPSPGTSPPAFAPIAPGEPNPDGPPPGRLEVPAHLAAAIAAAIEAGRKTAAGFGEDHTPAERWGIVFRAARSLPFPPDDAEGAKEIAVMKQIAAARTQEGVALAAWHADHGMDDLWMVYLREYQKSVGPEQARKAAKLLRDTLDMTSFATQVTKASANRPRPYEQDPSLPIAIRRPGHNPSYPSGHTSAAFAAALVLAHLMPDKRNELLDLATQSAYARVYGGVHFPSDIVAGARLAASIASYTVTAQAP